MIPDSAQQFLGGALGLALIAAALGLLAALVVYAAFALLVRRQTAARPDSPIIPALRATQKHAALFCVIAGAFSATLASSRLPDPALPFLVGREDWIYRAWTVLAIIQASHLLTVFARILVEWYAENVARQTETVWDDNLIPLIRRISSPTIYALGALTALDTAGVSITPLLAGVGIGGLAVALAVQPTLSNMFSGYYLLGEGDLNEGDFIEMDGGPSGFVVDVGWRATRIRDRFNNIILIPNSKLIESVVTNYQSQNAAVTAVVECGVSYESDLAHVERTALEAAQSARNDLDEAVDDFDPVVRFTTFGESNVDLVVVMQAADRLGSFVVKHEVIKRIHTSFAREGIEINYPVRKVIGDGREERTSSA